MFTSTVDKKTLGEVNALLISGTSLKETSELSGLNYQRVQYLRNKLVKAGALQPLHVHKVTRKKRTSRLNRTQRVSTLNTETQSTNYDGIKLVINGTQLNIRNAKSVDVYTDLVDIKY